MHVCQSQSSNSSHPPFPRGGGLVTKLCLTLATPWTVACQASSVHGILQARVLEWVAISFSRGSSQPRNQTWISYIADRFLPTELWGKPFSLWCPCLFSMPVSLFCFENRFVCTIFSKFHMLALIRNICFFLSDLLRSYFWQSLDPSTSLQMAWFCFFFMAE